MASPSRHQEEIEGPDAATLIAAGIGVLALGLITPFGAWLVTSRQMGYAATRPVLTVIAFLLWGAVWSILRRHWSGRMLPARTVLLCTSICIVGGLLLGTPILAWFWPGIHLP